MRPRREIWEIQETVFKEAILKTLTHRDYYDKGGVILLELFENRAELYNPGGLVSAIPESEFGKCSHARNPLIFVLFARMHLVEQVGSGIVRRQDLVHQAKLPPPQFQKTGIFTVTLIGPEKSSVKSSVKGSVKIIELIKEYPAVTISEMADALNGAVLLPILNRREVALSVLINTLPELSVAISGKFPLATKVGVCAFRCKIQSFPSPGD
jgi:ATP-dependent DNA helicase RecG